MHNKEFLSKNLRALPLDPKGVLLIHISYKAVGQTEGGPEALIESFAEFMKDGLLIIPSHTWANVGAGENQTRTMDVLSTPCCIGVIPEMFRKREGVLRSLHPTHSLSVLGKNAAEFIAGEEKARTPCGRNFCYGKLIDYDASIMLIGVGHNRNTFIHGIEEFNRIPGRLDNELTDLYVRDPCGTEYYTPQYRHKSRVGSEAYTKIDYSLIERGIVREAFFGSARVKIMKAARLNKEISKMLKKDTALFDYL